MRLAPVGGDLMPRRPDLVSENATPFETNNADNYESAIRRLGQDNYVQGPSCGVAVKAKNLLIHCNKAHKGNWPSVDQVAGLTAVGNAKDFKPPVSVHEKPAQYPRPTGSKSSDWNPNVLVLLVSLVAVPWVHYGVNWLAAFGAISILGFLDGLTCLVRKNKFGDQFGPLLFVLFGYYLIVVIAVGIAR